MSAPRLRSYSRIMDLNIHPRLPSKRDYRIGCIGSGFIMSDCHLVAYRKAGFNVAGIASRTVENARRAAEMHKLPKVYGSTDELLDDPGIEVLDIAVPPHRQADSDPDRDPDARVR